MTGPTLRHTTLIARASFVALLVLLPIIKSSNRQTVRREALCGSPTIDNRQARRRPDASKHRERQANRAP